MLPLVVQDTSFPPFRPPFRPEILPIKNFNRPENIINRPGDEGTMLILRVDLNIGAVYMLLVICFGLNS